MLQYLVYFLVGGAVVTAISVLAEKGHPLLAGVVTLFPSITLVSFYFIGKSTGNEAVAATAKSCFIALSVWIPYILTIIWLSPRIGTNKALVIGVLIFIVLACALIYANRFVGVVQT
ncbi:MAG: hypothetical protein EFT35_02375 [Methanophagales archaeon ANME-1-THS]|nr:MAG: hypothetical protein EFT35_02375 [Methanophagales archaeon ANME-1-THS]